MHYANEETITVVSIGLCLRLVNIAAYFDYSTALGAFIMGSILAETPLIDRIRSLIKPIRDVFAAIFFMSVGMLINPHTIIQHWEAVLLITLITIIGKLIGNSLGALLTGQNLSTSLRIGFGMAQVGEFSFIIVGLGLVLKVIDDALYSIIVAVCGVTAFTTPYLIRLSDQVVRKIDTHLPDSIKNFLIAYSTYTNNVLLKLKNYSNYNALFRLFINGIIITIIFLLVDKFIYAKLLCWFVALLLSSPFLWGILFAYKTRPLSPTNWLGKIYCWLEQHFVGNIGKNDLHHK